MKFPIKKTIPGVAYSTYRTGSADRIRVIHIDESGYSLEPTSFTASAAEQFHQFMKGVICSVTKSQLTSAQLAIACCVAFELLHEQDLLPFLKGLGSAETLGGKVYVSWSIDQVWQRREICSFTLVAHSKVSMNTDWDDELRKFSEAIYDIYDFGLTIAKDRTLKNVFKDLQAWAYTYLPMPVVSHYLGIVPTTHLKDHVWRRKFGLVASSKIEPESKLSNSFRNAEAQTIEALVESTIPLSGMWVIENLSTVCSGITGVGVSISDTRAWRKLVVRISRIAGDLKRAGPVESLMVGWSIHLVRYGSARKENPKVATVARYISSALSEIYLAIRATNTHPFDISTERWRTLFEGLLSDHEQGSVFRSAVLSFHAFLVRTIDAEPQFWMFKGKDRVYVPRANVVWPCEVQALPDFIRQSVDDERQAHQICTWIQLLSNMALRISELKWIRLSDIEINDDLLTLQIVSRRYSGSGKTPAASRGCFTQNQDCIAALLDWRSRREAEGADLDDLLFGDPHNFQSVYKMGSSYALLSRAMKAVTGDPDCSPHHFRHSVISFAVENALLTSANYSEINPIHKIQVEAGHKSSEMTLGTYFHLIESVIRYWIDFEVGQLAIPYSAIALWTDEKTSTLAQQKHRAKDAGWTFMDAIRTASLSCLPITTLSKKFSQPIATRNPAQSHLDFRRVIYAISDLIKGHSEMSIGLRNSLSEKVVRDISIAFTALHGPASELATQGRMHLCYERCNWPNWTLFYRSIPKFPEEDLVSAIGFWTTFAEGGVLVLAASKNCASFVQLLKHSGIGVNRIVVRMQGGDVGGADQLGKATRLTSAFRSVYGTSPQIEAPKFRRGRSSCYFMILTKAPRPEQTASAATNDTATLNALMTALVVFRKLTSLEQVNASH